MHSLNIARSTTVFGDWSAASGWQKTFELLHLQPRISAIVVANDQMALGVLSALAQLNRSGSRAVSVTGYDDTADSLYFQPPLTTVAQDFDLLGKRAVERLIALMRPRSCGSASCCRPGSSCASRPGLSPPRRTGSRPWRS